LIDPDDGTLDSVPNPTPAMAHTPPLLLTFRTVMTTPAPPAAVWRALEATERWPEVKPDIAAARIEPNGRLEAGATIRTFVKPGHSVTDMEYRVLAAERPHRVVWMTRVPRLRVETELVLANDASGTRLEVTLRVDGETLFSRLFLFAFRRRYEEALLLSAVTRLRPLLTLAKSM
jgi:uncharacterized protein YndB with AHSA1/START domain